ncbi:hypothetical protein [Deinococcus humi]|uniref:Uncharacterized protein n=1 Tax=Deinococcus humi TaxID=662880 RepID=A0A7W8NIB4_9DEIO|nr:hypothetical protein [Deinococcus humi]MBB5365668.1 hypothetical protein [Deinococcus humi]GGO37043.1 hypothetical protein GCM10008949_41740 [Deinococcus humi]
MTASRLTPERLATEATRRAFLDAQVAALRAGHPEAAPRSPICPAPLATRLPIDPTEALKAVGLYRKSIRAKPVLSGYTPTKTFWPVAFPYKAGQHLTKLSRSVSRDWRMILTSISTTSLAGGRLTSSQGLNLIRIVEELRKHCYLKVSEDGRPLQSREQVVQMVGGRFCFARECGMSEATFYRALKHPLAHLWLRSQKVQRIDQDTAARRNAATLFSVSLYEPVIPEDLEAAFFAESVQEAEIFVVPDFTFQLDRTKGSSTTTQKQRDCGKPEGGFGASSAETAREDLLRCLDGAALIARAGERGTLSPNLDSVTNSLEGCLDRLRNANPQFWEFAVQIAIHHDDPATHAVAAIGFYKALVHLGVKTVRRCIQRLEKWRLKGQKIETPGRLLMHLLNEKARAATGFNIHDLGTEPGGVVA